MKLKLIVLSTLICTSGFAGQTKVTCRSAKNLPIEFVMDFTTDQKKLVYFNYNNQDLTKDTVVDQGTQNTYSITVKSTNVKFSKKGATLFTQTVAGGSPIEIKCKQDKLNASNPTDPVM